ncbi:MAG: hypothetical protein AAF578_14945 [Pseudomonadota bacterium]
MKDPEAINRAIAEKLKEKRSSIIPYLIGGFIFLNVIGALLESGSWKTLLVVLAFLGSWAVFVVLPRVRRSLKDIAQNAGVATPGSESGTRPGRARPKAKTFKLCKSCNIKHSADTRYCRRCGAPLLR